MLKVEKGFLNQTEISLDVGGGNGSCGPLMKKSDDSEESSGGKEVIVTRSPKCLEPGEMDAFHLVGKKRGAESSNRAWSVRAGC